MDPRSVLDSDHAIVCKKPRFCWAATVLWPPSTTCLYSWVGARKPVFTNFRQPLSCRTFKGFWPTLFPQPLRVFGFFPESSDEVGPAWLLSCSSWTAYPSPVCSSTSVTPAPVVDPARRPCPPLSAALSVGPIQLCSRPYPHPCRRFCPSAVSAPVTGAVRLCRRPC